MVPRHSALLGIFAAAACSSSGAHNHGSPSFDSGSASDDASTDAGDDGSMASDDASDASDDVGKDSGTTRPCGVTAGKTLCDVPLEGYVRDATTGLATSVPYGSFKLSEALAKGTEKYAMVFLGGFW
jgi:hypothetical protein